MQLRLLLASIALSACYKSTLDVAFTDLAADADGSVAQFPTASRDAGPAQIRSITSPLTYYRDVKPLIEAKCSQCHVPGGMGHFPLTNFDEVKSLARVIKGAVSEGAMPPWRATGPLDRYVGDRRLSEEQKSVIVSWVDQGAKAGEPSEEPPRVIPEKRALPRVDGTLPLPAPFTPPPNTDTYRCFVLDWPYTQTKFITGLSIEPGNKALVHHSILYLLPPAQVQSVREREALDAEPGFECTTGAGLNSQWLTSYEPGGYGEENPGGLGFQVAPGSVLVLQMHYNTLRSQGSDNSTVQVMLADQVARIGTVSLILNPLWTFGGMPIPANDADNVKTWTGRPLGLDATRSYDLFWADLHAHTLASQMYMGIVRAGQTAREPLLEIPDWSFDWQETFRFRQSVRLNPDDKLYVECHFKNTEDKQAVINGERLPVRDVNWGERTIDEMCLGNVLATPAL